MGRQMGKQFTWVLENFSSLEDEFCYSRPFTVAGCDWRLVAYPKGDGSDGYLSVFLDLARGSLPPGWRKDVNFRITLVNDWGKSNKILEGQGCFDAEDSNWGFKEFLPLFKLHRGFLVNDRLIFFAELNIFPAIVLPKEPVKIIEPLSSKEANQASDASISKSQVDSSCQVVQNTENASNEDLDVDDVSGEGSDEDYTSEEASDDDDDDESEEDPDDDGDASSSVSAETEVSNGETDDALKEDVKEEATSHVSNDSARNGSSLDQVKSLETVENGGRGLDTVSSVTGTSGNVLMEIQPVKETMDVNGFEVFSSQVESVSYIFKRHPDIAMGFRPKNQQIRRAYMDALLSLIDMLCQSPEELTENDLSNADETLVDLTDAGFKLDWLKTKLNEISEKKKMEQVSGARLQTMEEQLQKLKQMFLDVESLLQKEKVEALAARVPLSFNDVVC
ncbi:MATH domain and coiled-coil domain-containing protein [Cardamine amara subsp. amara]|uniref:MATH domain and coiled-coil domain-containing protein n=1 Tax=Cardamine amara subsp. amara TaxID=228776 RepID=A0ABD1A653_CARAN